jgi:transcriptional regulator with PAS, ATPase and Fis domain
MKQIGFELTRGYLQDFIESLAQVLDLEITIADHNFIRIAGSGVFKNKISQKLPVGSIYRASIINSRPFIVEKTVVSEYCRYCEFREKCTVMAEACVPIIIENKVLGVLGIVAVTDSQREKFVKKRIDYYNCILKLAELIRTVLIFGETEAESGIISRELSPKIATFSTIVCKCEKMVQAIEIAKKAAQSNANVLIEGESGTGKELFARAIHAASFAKGGRFEPVICSAIPDSLIESELFGYEYGAFTGARKGGKIGKFMSAHNGTIFLDEIADIPINIQAKLLRTTEDKYVYRLGGIDPIEINTRIIAATSQNLRKLIKQGKFRMDLFYRLNVLFLSIPPLRDRNEDVDLLAEVFLKKYNKLYKKGIILIEDRLRAHFHKYLWPGNVRELMNLIEYGVCVETGSILREETVYHRLEQNQELEHYNRPFKSSLLNVIKNIERQMIRETLDKFKDEPRHIEKAAKVLRVSKATLYRKLKDNWDQKA